MKYKVIERYGYLDSSHVAAYLLSRSIRDGCTIEETAARVIRNTRAILGAAQDTDDMSNIEGKD